MKTFGNFDFYCFLVKSSDLALEKKILNVAYFQLYYLIRSTTVIRVTNRERPQVGAALEATKRKKTLNSEFN